MSDTKNISQSIIQQPNNVDKNVSRLAKAIEMAVTDEGQTPNGLFKQVVKIAIGDSVKLDGETLDFEFSVPFDCDVEPNEAEVIIYNLSKTTIAQIKRNSKITIEAGYKNDTGIIFTGYISKVSTKKDGVDKKTTIYALDDQSLTDRELQEKSYAANVKSSYILKDILATTKLPFAIFSPAADYVNKDAVKVDGSVIEAVKKYAEDCQSAAYVQKGKLYVLDIRKASKDINFTICVETGMISSPEEFTEEANTSDKDKKAQTIKGYKVEMLLQHRIQSGVKVRIESTDVSGVYSVRSGEHKYTGTELTTSIECIA